MAHRKTWTAAAVVLLLVLAVAIRSSLVNKDIMNMTAYEIVEAQVDSASSGRIKDKVIKTLRKVGIDLPPGLLDKLRNTEYSMSLDDAAENLGPEAIPSLIEALTDDSSRVREMAARYLSRIGPEAEEAVPALIEALKDDSSHVRQCAIDALEEIGPAAKEAVPALIGALKDGDEFVRNRAAIALNSIDPKTYPVRPLIRLPFIAR